MKLTPALQAGSLKKAVALAGLGATSAGALYQGSHDPDGVDDDGVNDTSSATTTSVCCLFDWYMLFFPFLTNHKGNATSSTYYTETTIIARHCPRHGTQHRHMHQRSTSSMVSSPPPPPPHLVLLLYLPSILHNLASRAGPPCEHKFPLPSSLPL